MRTDLRLELNEGGILRVAVEARGTDQVFGYVATAWYGEAGPIEEWAASRADLGQAVGSAVDKAIRDHVQHTTF